MTPYLAINGECDAPSPLCIVVVHEESDKGFKIEYITKRIRVDPKWRKPFLVSKEAGVVPVLLFGQVPVLDGDVISTTQVGRSLATYSDGNARAWQPGSFPRCTVDKRVLETVRQAIQGTGTVSKEDGEE